MIILVHQHNKVTKVLDANMQINTDVAIGQSVTKAIETITEKHQNTLVIWCRDEFLKYLDIENLQSIFHHQRVLASFNPSSHQYLPNQIGYIERAFFLKVNKSVNYPTWLMNNVVGGINTSVIDNLKTNLNFETNFDYFLNSLAKRAMVEGLFCYSEPKLLQPNAVAITEDKEASTYTLFKFVKQHYKWVWVFFLAACYLIYEKKFKLLPLIKSLFYRQLSTSFNLEELSIVSKNTVINKKEIDVIIPTIGRKKYLYDVLQDLAVQTILPKNIIIVEQNLLEGSTSELDYLTTKDWPFNIKHTFTHQSGVCNARNIALSQVESEWTFFADDDIRFNNLFFEDSFKIIDTYGIKALSYLCLQPNEKQSFFKMHQTTIFGSGSSMVKSNVLKDLKFNMAFEFGFGEDNEFGMQIRNQGCDVVFIPNIKLTHLKAPMGGYRTKVKQLWANDKIAPKPSPTIQLLNQMHFTNSQLLGYKLLLGLHNYKQSKTKNPFTYIKHYKKQWKRSQYWSAKL